VSYRGQKDNAKTFRHIFHIAHTGMRTSRKTKRQSCLVVTFSMSLRQLGHLSQKKLPLVKAQE
jgi:hypothetical protein